MLKEPEAVVEYEFMNSEGAACFHRRACVFAKSVKSSTRVVVTTTTDHVADATRLAESYGGTRR